METIKRAAAISATAPLRPAMVKIIGGEIPVADWITTGTTVSCEVSLAAFGVGVNVPIKNATEL